MWEGANLELFFRQKVYPIADMDMIRQKGLDVRSVVARWVSLGIECYQLRNKSGTDEQSRQIAMDLREQFDRTGIIINDSWELALAYEDLFCGVHVGQKDLDRLLVEHPEKLPAFRGYVNRVDTISGVSTHNPLELARILPREALDLSHTESFGAQPARNGLSLQEFYWSYIAVGPFFPTRSKTEDLSPVLDREGRQEIYSVLQRLIQGLSTGGEFAKEPKNEPQIERGTSARGPLLNTGGHRIFFVPIGGINADTIGELMEEFSRELPDVLPLPALIGAGLEEGELERIIEVMSPYYA